MKTNYKIMYGAVLLLTVAIAGCKKDTILSPETAKAYMRLLFIDAPGRGKVQFLLDGTVNANGDSLLYNPDGTPFLPTPGMGTTTTVNYPSGGWMDNSPVKFPGAYGYNNAAGSNYTFFPNPTNRIDLAPVIGGNNFYNWAALPAGQHQLSLFSVINSTAFGNPISIRGDKFLDQALTLEGGAVQTVFVLNKAVAKTYQCIENTNVSSPLPVYGMTESINHFTNTMDLVTMTDHPDKLPAFKDSSAYIRFLNVTPTYTDQATNQSTDSLDVYIAPIYGKAPDVYSVRNARGYKVSDSIGRERLVTKGLTRFRSAVDAPFFEVNVAEVMRTGGKIYSKPAAGEQPVPRYYRVLAYRTGMSNATGDFPVAKGDWLALFNLYPGYDYDQSFDPFKTWVDSWLVRSDGNNFHPAICTILLSVGQNVFKGTDAAGNTRYLGFRSVVNYQRAGVNDGFFSK